MKCPQCGGELKYPQVAYDNMDRYMTACTVATLCCGKGVRLIPRMVVEAVPAKGMERDDWGNPIDE